jgi:hypothetical protein
MNDVGHGAPPFMVGFIAGPAHYPQLLPHFQKREGTTSRRDNVPHSKLWSTCDPDLLMILPVEKMLLSDCEQLRLGLKS